MFAAINVLGSQFVGKAETYIVAVELLIIVSFVVFGFSRQILVMPRGEFRRC